MPPDRTDPTRRAQDELATWHATHPDATFAELEAAVEEQLDRIRREFLEARTRSTFVEEHPICRACGATMKPSTTGKRTVVLRGEHPLELERQYVVCPQCGAGFFPPG